MACSSFAAAPSAVLKVVEMVARVRWKLRVSRGNEARIQYGERSKKD